MSSCLPTKYYLKAKDPKHALLVQGKVFWCVQSPWDWLRTVTTRADAKDFFTVEPIEEVYFATKYDLRFSHERETPIPKDDTGTSDSNQGSPKESTVS